MTLAKLQSALAALLMEPDSLAAFKADPHAYVEEHGLKGKDAALLAGVPAEGASFFASRRRIDRFSYLRGDLPKSVHVLVDHDVGTDAYFDDCPYAFEDPRMEVKQFLAWAQQGARRGRCTQLLADAALVEVTAFELYGKPFKAAKAGNHPKLAPGVKVLQLQHDLWDQIEDAEVHDAPPGKLWVALQRTHDDVEPHKLNELEAKVLSSANGKRSETALAKANGLDLRAVGLVVNKFRRNKLLAPTAA